MLAIVSHRILPHFIQTMEKKPQHVGRHFMYGGHRWNDKQFAKVSNSITRTVLRRLLCTSFIYISRFFSKKHVSFLIVNEIFLCVI
jgi:hypothetical protein